MFKKYLIFIILFINGFIAIAQSLDNKYSFHWSPPKLYLSWDKNMGDSLEIEIIGKGQKHSHKCRTADGTWEDRMPQQTEEPIVRVYLCANGKRQRLPPPTAFNFLKDGLCVQLPSETMSATRQKEVFTLTFDMQKSCNVSDTTLVKTRLYWSKDSWANPKIDILLQEQDLPFGNQIHLSGKYNLEKGAKNGFLFLQIIDEKGNILLTTETIAAES